MNRIELIQEIFKKNNFKNYLEIGCSEGKSFLPIKAKNKTAVDPFFQISLSTHIKWLIRNPRNLNNHYFEEESDTFFQNRKTHLRKIAPLNVVLIDGLHTFRAALNDVLNSLHYLASDGIIIMHDCLPPTKAAASPTKSFPTAAEIKQIEGWNKEWCGDVWKSIVYLSEVLHDELDVCVLNTDFGLGIIRPKKNINKEKLKINEQTFSKIDRLTYEDLIKNTKAMLNLKAANYANVIISDLCSKTSEPNRKKPIRASS